MKVEPESSGGRSRNMGVKNKQSKNLTNKCDFQYVRPPLGFCCAVTRMFVGKGNIDYFEFECQINNKPNEFKEDCEVYSQFLRLNNRFIDDRPFYCSKRGMKK